jgi:hypothetical protein
MWDLKDLRTVSGQTMVQKRPNDASSHKRGAVNLEGGEAEAEGPARPLGAKRSRSEPAEQAERIGEKI